MVSPVRRTNTYCVRGVTGSAVLPMRRIGWEVLRINGPDDVYKPNVPRQTRRSAPVNRSLALAVQPLQNLHQYQTRGPEWLYSHTPHRNWPKHIRETRRLCHLLKEYLHPLLRGFYGFAVTARDSQRHCHWVLKIRRGAVWSACTREALFMPKTQEWQAVVLLGGSKCASERRSRGRVANRRAIGIVKETKDNRMGQFVVYQTVVIAVV